MPSLVTSFVADEECLEILEELKKIMGARSTSEVLRCIIHDYADLVKENRDDSSTAP